MIAHATTRRTTLLIGLSALLLAQAAETVSPSQAITMVGNTRVTTCRNWIETICERCCWGYENYVADATAGCPPEMVSSGSVIDDVRMTHIHYSDDWKTAEPGAGCAPCGSTGGAGGADGSLLPALRIQRIHRYRDITLTGSFGPGVFLNYDINLTLSATQARVWDPRGQIELVLGKAAGATTYVDTRLGSVKGITLFDALGVAIANPATATTAVLTNHGGERYVFTIIRTDPNPAATTVRGRLERYADRRDNAITISYVYPAGASDADLGFDRHRLWQMDRVTDAYGREAAFTYQAATVAGRYVVERIDLPGGVAVQYQYTNPGLGLGTWDIVGLNQVTLPNGDLATITTFLDAPSQCQVVRFDDPGAEGTHRRKDVYLTCDTWVDPVTSISYAQSGRLVRLVIDGAGDVTYVNEEGVLAATDPAVVNGYAQTGDNVVTSYVGGKRAKRWIHRGDFPVASDTIAAGTFGATGWTITALEKTESYDHDAKRRITAVRDALNRATLYARDPVSAAPLTITYPDSTTHTTTYNGFKLPLTSTDRLGRITHFTYDSSGNLLTRTAAVGTAAVATWSWTYNGRGQPITATDANGNVTDYAYDSRGYLQSITEPADAPGDPRAVRTFVFDAVGRLASETDANGRTVTYAYDARNRVTAIGYQDGSFETFTYGTGVDANLLVASTDRNGNLTTRAYDAAGRVVITTQAAGTNVAVSEYCAFLPGTTQKLTCLRAGELTSYTHDYRNRVVTTTTYPRAGVALVTSNVYDGVQRLAAQIDAYGRRTLLAYDINDRIVRHIRERVPNGVPGGANLVTLPRLLSANPAYVVEETAFDAEGQILARTDGRGIRQVMTYDGQGRLSSQVQADAHIDGGGTVTLLAEAARTEFLYDAQGNRTAVLLPRSFLRSGGSWLAGSSGVYRTSMTYTGRNLVATTIEADGLDAGGQVRAERAVTSRTYTLTRQLATSADARGFTTIHRYSACCDRLVEIEDPSGALTHLAYDPYGNRTSVTDANGNVTTWAYDARHRVSQQVNGAGEATLYAYDDDLTDGAGLDAAFAAQIAGLGFVSGVSDGSAVLVTNPASETNLQIQDGLGRTVRQVDGNGNAVTITHDTVVGDLVETAVADALGHTTRTRADGSGLVRESRDAEGALTTQGFDGNGNRVSLRDPAGVGMDCVYDGLNRETQCTDTRSDVLTVRLTSFDTHGNVVSQTDAFGAVESSVYDARDRRVSHTDRVSATTLFAYDASSNLTQITDAEGGVTDYVYDSRNLLVQETFPTGSLGNRTVRTYSYDLGRRLTQRVVTTNPASSFSEATLYGYDQANRLLSRAYPADGLDDTFQYDVASRLIAAQSNRYRVDVTRAYDAGGRLTSEAQIVREGSLSGTTVSAATYTVGYAYDAANRTTQITYPDGAVVTRDYTDRNQLETVDHTPFGGSAAAVIDRVYDSAGRLIETEYGNGLVETRDYTPDSHLVAGIAIPGVTDFGYVYDANRRKTQEANGILPAQTQDFSYDDQDRLTGWERPVVADVQAWTLSLVGDWNSTTRNGIAETRTHTDVHELTSRTIGANPAIPLGYDAKGNLADDGEGRVYTWDPENRLSRAVVSSTASPTGFGLVAVYQYDALGRRVAKTWGGKTTRYLSAGAQVVEERDGAPVPTQAAITGGSVDGDLANLDLTPPTGGILAGTGVVRVNFQPNAEVVPAGYLKDSGKLYAMRTNGHSYGWDAAITGESRVRRGAVPLPELDTLIHLQKSATPRTWEVALPNGTYPVIVVAGDPVYRDQTNNLSIEGIQVIDPDPSSPPGYEKGDFDGYAVLAVVTDGRLTITPGPGAVNAKLCFVEIGPEGTAIDQATLDRLADLVESATSQTAIAAGAVTAKRQYVYGTYVDELLSYTVGAGASPTRYFTHANHLYSIAATTNAAGAVVERYGYDAYGTQTVTNAAGTVELAASSVSQSRGFTGYILDRETGIYHARARKYDSRLGRFVGRDPLGYVDGMGLYSSYFVPGRLDPRGTACCVEEIVVTTGGESGNSMQNGVFFPESGVGMSDAVWNFIDDDKPSTPANYGPIMTDRTFAFNYSVEIFIKAGGNIDECTAYQSTNLMIYVRRAKKIGPGQPNDIVIRAAHDGKDGRPFDYGWHVPAFSDMLPMSEVSFGFDDAPGIHLGANGPFGSHAIYDANMYALEVEFRAEISATGTDGVTKTKNIQVDLFGLWSNKDGWYATSGNMSGHAD